MSNINIKIDNVFGGLHFNDTYPLTNEKELKKIIRKYIKLISEQYNIEPKVIYYTKGLNTTGLMRDSYDVKLKSTKNISWFIRKVVKHYMEFPIACFSVSFSDGEMYDFDITEE